MKNTQLNEDTIKKMPLISKITFTIWIIVLLMLVILGQWVGVLGLMIGTLLGGFYMGSQWIREFTHETLKQSRRKAK